MGINPIMVETFHAKPQSQSLSGTGGKVGDQQSHKDSSSRVPSVSVTMSWQYTQHDTLTRILALHIEVSKFDVKCLQ